ncbi:MAG: branched-chain amino acid ABC transporter permease [Armatimonadota bacterium]
MSPKRILRAIAVILLLAALQWLFSLPQTISPYAVRILNLCCISIMLAVSLNIINGYAGQFSLGHAGFYGAGAYASAAFSVYAGPAFLRVFSATPGWLSDGVLLVLAVATAALTAAVAGLIVGIPSLRLKGDYLAIATLGFGEMIRVAVTNIDAVGGSRGFTVKYTLASFFWIALFTVGCVWISRNLLNSREGRALQAIRDDEVAASVVGIDVTRSKVTAFVLSAALAGCAGALYAHYDGFIKPESFRFERSIEIVIMVVIGGLGSTTGAVFAAVVLTVLPETLRQFEDYRMVLYSALLVICMLVRPQGMLGTKEFTLHTLVSRRKENKGGLT